MSVTDDNERDDDDNNVNDNGSKNEDEPEIEPGGHTKPSSNKTLSSCHLEREEALILTNRLVDVINM